MRLDCTPNGVYREPRQQVGEPLGHLDTPLKAGQPVGDENQPTFKQHRCREGSGELLPHGHRIGRAGDFEASTRFDEEPNFVARLKGCRSVVHGRVSSESPPRAGA